MTAVFILKNQWMVKLTPKIMFHFIVTILKCQYKLRKFWKLLQCLSKMMNSYKPFEFQRLEGGATEETTIGNVEMLWPISTLGLVVNTEQVHPGTGDS